MANTGFHLSFYLMCGVLLWMVLRGLVRGRTVFEYPTLAAMMGIAWVVPQGIELELNPHSPYTSGAFWLYVTGCFLFIFWGFHAGRKAKRRRIARAPEQELRSFSARRLLVAAIGLTALGQIAVFQMRGIDTSGMGSQWTGVITMWALLAKANGFGLCLAVLLFARTRSRVAFAVALIAAIPLLQAAFIGVRREALFDLLILTAGAWYLSKRSYPPRGVVIACLFVGTVILNSAGEIRGQVRSGESTLFNVLTSSETYREFNFFDLGQGSGSEVGLARYDFWYANQSWHWEFGSNYWNALVNQYVPAFLLGRQFKESLKISTLAERLSGGQAVGAFSLGSTRTGFSDSYRSFGVLGMLVFGAIGYSFGFLYAIANSGGLAGQYLYLVLMAEGLKAITHSTSEFISALPFALILSLLALRYARSPVSAARFHQSVRELQSIQ